MTEEQVSRALYEAAGGDPKVMILSWQGVDGKGYFASDIKLRLPDRHRIEPDLVLAADHRLWLVEIKGGHVEAVSDERKLAEAVVLLGEAEILRQVQARSGVDMENAELVIAVAYFGSDTQSGEPGHLAGCVEHVAHIDWRAAQGESSDLALSEFLNLVYRTRQRST
ncbi:MAG TPA: hypothetical protein VFT19_01980 [Solirubrobacterales bacterium]|nr:hypothetical protein [Solirubrobacterales bacterium]